MTQNIQLFTENTSFLHIFHFCANKSYACVAISKLSASCLVQAVHVTEKGTKRLWVLSRGYVYVRRHFRNGMIGRSFVQSEAEWWAAHVAEVCTLTWKKELAEEIKPYVYIHIIGPTVQTEWSASKIFAVMHVQWHDAYWWKAMCLPAAKFLDNTNLQAEIEVNIHGLKLATYVASC